MKEAASRAGVIWLGLFVLGLGLGVLVASHDLPWWLAPMLSWVVFAGSVEFILVGLLAAATPLASIALTTLLVNSRHLFYGLTFPVHRIRSRAGRAYSIYALCDEAYALITTAPAESMPGRTMLWTQFGLQAFWATGSLIGGLAGGTVLGTVPGIDFVLTALFVVLAVDAYRADPDRVTVALALLAGVTAVLVAPGAMLLVAMTLFAALLVARHLITTRKEAAHA